ncbi:hypothetical protein ACHAQA_006286 [Verticillium albo-atrum]
MARLHVSAFVAAAGLVATAAASAHLVARETAEAHLVARQTAVPDVSAISDCEVVASTQYCFYEGGAEVQVVLADATVAPEATSSEAAPTALTSCHPHDSAVYCMHGTTEYSMGTTATATQDIPAQYTDCHSHGTELFCVDEAGGDVQAVAEGQEASADEDTSGDPQTENCHFHAGVEHCVAPGESESGGTERSCEKVDRDYDIPLRVGLLFVVLVTSAIGVFGPIFLMRVLPSKLHVIFLIIKQFGTGVIISTAFVHLYTHAQLMFANPCLGALKFEGTTSAVVMAGIFLSFLVEYIGQRVVKSKLARGPDATSWFRPETVSIMVLEAGILFHSILIGITLVVAGDSFFKTLFIVIIFHQVFEGLALGSRIAALGTLPSVHQVPGHGHGHGHNNQAQVAPTKSVSDTEPAVPASPESSDDSTAGSLKPVHYSLKKKCLLASAFALITPIGMAIGIAVLDQFNGNDPQTIVAIGTLDAVSAGILIWVGLVEMWAEDWMYPSSELMNSSPLVTALSLFGLVAGMALMSFLGKWA